MTALADAAEKYFAKSPDQQKEGAFQDILKQAYALSIERHRIAHGHITMGSKIDLPEEKGPSVVDVTFLYRWDPPFDGVRKLRTNPVGADAASIDATSRQFEDLNNKAIAFTDAR